MRCEDLNRLILQHLPNIKDIYLDEVSWQEGDSTGSHIVYGDVLTPYLVKCIKNKRTKEVKTIFKLIEEILGLNDDYADEVIYLSVFESIAYIFDDYPDTILLLGYKSKKVLNEIMKFS